MVNLDFLGKAEKKKEDCKSTLVVCCFTESIRKKYRGGIIELKDSSCFPYLGISLGCSIEEITWNCLVDFQSLRGGMRGDEMGLHGTESNVERMVREKLLGGNRFLFKYGFIYGIPKFSKNHWGNTSKFG